MSKQGTPMPWVTVGHTAKEGYLYIMGPAVPGGSEFVDVCHIPPSASQEADEALISAAPEMRDVLASIENDKGQVPEWLWARIQSVLAKVSDGGGE